MGAHEEITLAILGQPNRLSGHLVSLRGLSAELQMDEPPHMPAGTLVEFQNCQTLWLGEVQPNSDGAGKNAVLVRLEHSLDLEKLAAIQKSWNAEPAE